MMYAHVIRFLFVAIFLLEGGSLLAQLGKKEISWNYLPDEHRYMTEYAFDKGAEAVVLHDLGIWAPISLERGELVIRRHRRIKIFKETAIRFKDVVLPYETDEKIKNLKARTINWEDGKKKVSKLELKYLPEEETGPGKFRKSFSFKDVKTGSIIEYQYDLQTKSLEWLKPWYFQDEIPVLHSEIQLDNLVLLNYSTFPQIHEVPPYTRGRYQMRHVRALKKEPFVANWNDYRAGIRFQLKDNFELRDEQREWQLITMDLQEGTLFLDDSITQNALYSLTQSLIRSAITEEEKVSLIFDHVRKNIRWNQKSDTWLTKTPSQVYKDREGSSVEINMLLTQLLWLADLKAHRLFYRTRDLGVPLMYPLRNQFNDMMCVVEADGQTFFLDATDPFRSYDLIPVRALNKMGWLVKNDKANWVRIPGRFPATTNVVGLMRIDPDGHMHGEIKEILGGYDALSLRTDLQDRNSGEFIRNYLPDFEEITSHELNNVAEVNLPISILFNGGTRSFCQKKSDTLYIDPLLHYREKDNPFKSKNRDYPIDFGHFREKTILLSFLVPEGYKVAKIPENIRLNMVDEKISYEFACTYSGKTIQLRSSFQRKRANVQYEDYPAVREIYQKMVEKQSEKIILIPSP